MERIELFDDSSGSDGVGGADPASGGESGAGGLASTGGAGGSASSLVQGPSGANLVVDAGDAHSCGVVDGSLYCWGDNAAGQLGLGDFSSRATPTRVGTESTWTTVAVGSEFTCSIRAGEVWCAGSGSSGQLGDGAFGSSAEFSRVSLPESAEQLAVGAAFACAVLVDARAFCWGAGSEGQLAQDDPFPEAGLGSAVPVEVPGGDFARISAGQGHACGVKVDGTLFCWGRNSGGELGLGDAAPRQIRVPQQVGAESDWSTVAAGQSHTCGTRSNGSLHCWGGNSEGQLGLGDTDVRTEPALVADLDEVQQVTLDTFHTCVLRASGEILCSGRNEEGMLGADGDEDRASFELAAGETSYQSVAAGRFHSCAVAIAGGTSWFECTGENGDGRLGTGDSARRFEFTPTLFVQ